MTVCMIKNSERHAGSKRTLLSDPIELDPFQVQLQIGKAKPQHLIAERP
jgi:hypothetical protein